MVDIKERLNKEKYLEDLREKVRVRRKDLNKITV
jgi:phosphomevalonate kinase